VALGLLALLVGSGPAHARATVQTFEDQHTFTDTVDDSATCLGPGATGTITGTETTRWQVINTFDGDPYPGSPPTFHSHGTTTIDYRIAYDDGRSVIGSALERFAFSNRPNQPGTSLTTVVRDTGTLYGPDGRALGPVTVHVVAHVTFSDTNRNSQPDPGEFTANFDRFRITCP